jgi:hypothetical protein
MTTIQLLAEWALRSSILVLSGALLLRVLRVKDPSIRLAAWTAMLVASLAIPVLTSTLPGLLLAVPEVPLQAKTPAPQRRLQPILAAPQPAEQAPGRRSGAGMAGYDWRRAAVIGYALVAGALLLRLSISLAMSRRMLRNSRATGQFTGGIPIRESDRGAAPVVLGIVRSAILLPTDWRGWESAKLDAVLAHERSHILRRDPAVQLLSAIHRALLWHSPLS